MNDRDKPSYDLVPDATENAHALASTLRRKIREFREQLPDTTDKDVADAVRLLELRPEE